jgi:hypothetical protein
MNMNTKFYRNEWIVEHKGALYMPMIDRRHRRQATTSAARNRTNTLRASSTAAAESRPLRRRDRR